MEVSLKDSRWLGENLEEALGRRGLTVDQVLCSCNQSEQADSRKTFDFGNLPRCFENLPRCGPRRLSRNGHFAMLNFSVYLAMAKGLLSVV